jgi:hypothetical protein
MFKLFPGKSPMQMRREAAERAGRPRRAVVLGPADPARRPLQAAEDESDAALDAASDWLAHITAGRIEVR